MAQHASGGPAAQHVQVVDAVAAGEHGVDHGQQLGAGVGAGRAAQADQLVGGLLDAEPLGQGRSSSPALATAWRTGMRNCRGPEWPAADYKATTTVHAVLLGLSALLR